MILAPHWASSMRSASNLTDVPVDLALGAVARFANALREPDKHAPRGPRLPPIGDTERSQNAAKERRRPQALPPDSRHPSIPSDGAAYGSPSDTPSARKPSPQ